MPYPRRTMKSNPSRAVIELSINDQLVKIRPSTAACSGRLTKASSLNEIPSTSIPDGIYFSRLLLTAASRDRNRSYMRRVAGDLCASSRWRYARSSIVNVCRVVSA